MAILKNSSRDRFTVVDNAAVRDDRISLKALGLLVRLLSLPDNWEFSEDGLVAIFKKDGQTSIRSGLKELEAAGYLTRERKRDERGCLSSVEWNVYEKPHFENHSWDNPNLGSRPQYNKDLTKDEPKEESIYIPPYPQKGEEKRKSAKSDGLARWFYNGISEFTEEEQKLLITWAEYRKTIRKPLTERALTTQLKKLRKMASESNMSIKDYLEEVICRGWQAFYVISNPSSGASYSRPIPDSQGPTKPEDYEELFPDLLV